MNGKISKPETKAMKSDVKSKRTATRDLAGLVKNSIFRSSGKGKREIKYILLDKKYPKKYPKRETKC